MSSFSPGVSLGSLDIFISSSSVSSVNWQPVFTGEANFLGRRGDDEVGNDIKCKWQQLVHQWSTLIRIIHINVTSAKHPNHFHQASHYRIYLFASNEILPPALHEVFRLWRSTDEKWENQRSRIAKRPSDWERTKVFLKFRSERTYIYV